MSYSYTWTQFYSPGSTDNFASLNLAVLELWRSNCASMDAEINAGRDTYDTIALRFTDVVKGANLNVLGGYSGKDGYVFAWNETSGQWELVVNGSGSDTYQVKPTGAGDAAGYLGSLVDATLTVTSTSIGVNETWVKKTGAYTAVNRDKINADTSSAAFTITMPAATVGARISFNDYAKTFDSNNLTITPDGTDPIDGVNEDFIVDLKGARFDLYCDNVTDGWVIQ